MRTLKLMIQNALNKAGYVLNEELSDIDGVIEYLEMVNEHCGPEDVYTPEDWVEDTKNLYPEYLKRTDEVPVEM